MMTASNVLAGIAGLVGIGILMLYRKSGVFEPYTNDDNSRSYRIREGVRDYEVEHYASIRGAGWALIGGSIAILARALA